MRRIASPPPGSELKIESSRAEIELIENKRIAIGSELNCWLCGAASVSCIQKGEQKADLSPHSGVTSDRGMRAGQLFAIAGHLHTLHADNTGAETNKQWKYK